MRSSRNRRLVLVVVAVIALASCVHELPTSTETTCTTTSLTYENFGQPFVITWCRGCHSSQLPSEMRQQSPTTVNFDTLSDIKGFMPRLSARAIGDSATMPPAGGPPAEERKLFAEWLRCGSELK
jgi:uncharacterized membrane protein